MTFQNVTIPNQTLSENWFNGHHWIDQLRFEYVKIAVIEANAFNSKVFNRLLQLSFLNLIHIIRIEPIIFQWLIFLRDLSFEEKSVAQDNFPPNVLLPLSKTLRNFSYTGRIGTKLVLTNLFGRHKMPHISHVYIDCYRSSDIRSISAPNFSGLSSIQELRINQCGLERIEAGTFDYIAETLYVVNLVDNPLTHVTWDAFRVYLDRRPLWTEPHRKFIFLSMRCNAAFYRLRNATFMSFGKSNSLHCPSKAKDHLKFGSTPVCVELNSLARPIFQLKYLPDNHSVQIVQFDADPYRLFVWAMTKGSLNKDKQKLPRHAYARCRALHNRDEVMSLPTFAADTNKIGVCVISLSYRKQSLPSHCITVRIPMAELEDEDDIELAVISIEAIIGAFIFLCGLSCVIWCIIPIKLNGKPL